VAKYSKDATNNAKHDRNIRPPMIKCMTPGEVGCALWHVRLWQALSQSEVDSTIMLLLQDDVIFCPGKPASAAQQKPQPPGFIISTWGISLNPHNYYTFAVHVVVLGSSNIGKQNVEPLDASPPTCKRMRRIYGNWTILNLRTARGGPRVSKRHHHSAGHSNW
jgi:GR25 family glycosyltransferase involved in LPS biosynthesis